MGYPVIIEKLMDVLNARQGQTLTREQIAGLTGLTIEQVSTGMRSLVERTNGRVEVVLRARSWRMTPDVLASKVASIPRIALSDKHKIPMPKVEPKIEKAATPDVAVVVSTNQLVLTMFGHTTDGSEVGRDAEGQLYGVRKL